MERAPTRIISLVPSTTESVCTFGAAARLVGCTRWCSEPAAALTRTPRVGGTKNPDLEAIAALSPDLVLANAEENRADDVEWLRQRLPVLVQTPRTVPDAIADLRVLAERLGAGDAARGRYPEVEPQAAIALGADAVLLASEPWAFDVAQRDDVRAARLFGDARVELCDGRDFCWHGTHMRIGLPRARALIRSLAG